MSYTLNSVALDTETNRKESRPGYLRKYIQFLREFRSPFQHNVITFLFFVLIAAIFWTVRSLGEEYETEVTYPVRYVNFPENKVLIGEVPDKLRLRIRAKGFSIVKSKLDLNLIPLKFNVNSFSLNSIGADTFYIITETVRDLLSEELEQVRILDISPDTLFFRFTDIVVKKVVVKPILALHDKFFQKQYMQNGTIAVFPDSIIVSGPGTQVKDIHFIPTEPLSFTNLDDTVEIQGNLKKAPMLTYSEYKVRLVIPVDRFTEVEENLTVVPVHVPDSLSMIAIPGQVKVTYKICLGNYKKVEDNPLVAMIDYVRISENQYSRLPVFLSDTPRYINNVRFSPRETEFLITRK